MDGWMDVLMDGWMDGYEWMDGRTDGIILLRGCLIIRLIFYGVD